MSKKQRFFVPVVVKKFSKYGIAAGFLLSAAAAALVTFVFTFFNVAAIANCQGIMGKNCDSWFIESLYFLLVSFSILFLISILNILLSSFGIIILKLKNSVLFYVYLSAIPFLIYWIFYFLSLFLFDKNIGLNLFFSIISRFLIALALANCCIGRNVLLKKPDLY